MLNNNILQDQLIKLLDGGNAHAGIKDAIRDFSFEYYNKKVPELGYSAWQLLEHMRIAQWDILEFVINPEHISPQFPDGYWPDKKKTADQETWDKTIHDFENDLNHIKSIVMNNKMDLQQSIPHAPDYSYLREILLVADHNAYHTGQFIMLRKILGIW